MKMKNLFFVAALVSALSSCGNNEPENLMSPCVGKEGSPCVRTPINQQLSADQSIKV
jgi:hypothetical protein